MFISKQKLLKTYAGAQMVNLMAEQPKEPER